MLIRLNVPFKWHRPRDIIEVGGRKTGIDLATARRLIYRGYATDVDELITPLGGGWVEVKVADAKGGRTERVHGRKRALEVLRRAAGQ
jgi:hypothetical protein